ncbi:hypothetical protein TRVL_00366 [Trypanosoma vivax]|nr:hypothetical protein TRVL_00366 [Trypanosoma vivax]
MSPLSCAPARRSLKFPAGEQARHFLAFDTAISKHDRMILYMRLQTQASYLIDTNVLADFVMAPYLPEQYVELRVLTDPRHPAFGQVGLFAKKTIPANVVVTPYSGYIEIFCTSCNSRTYTMGYGSLSDDYALDAEFVGNYGRFANDPRGMEGMVANLSAESRFTSRGEAYTALVSRRIINKGEEILMSYGKAHSLTPSPWLGLKGEMLTRYRVGGIVPFPHLDKKRSRGDANENGAMRPMDEAVRSLSGPDACNNLQAADVRTASDDVSAVGDGSAETRLFWECPQCGTWSVNSMSQMKIDYCSFCHTPRLQRSRLVAVCCTAPIKDDDFVPSSIAPDSATVAEPCRGTALSPQSVDSGKPGRAGVSLGKGSEQGRGAQGGNSQKKLSSGDSGNFQVSGASTSSYPIDWPLNVPFLPWQVWDAAAPLSAIVRHSRFDTHDSIFLYTVASSDTDECDGESCEGNGRPNDVSASKALRGEREDKEEDGDEGGEGEVSPESETRHTKDSGRSRRVRRKKEDLWLKEGQQARGSHKGNCTTSKERGNAGDGAGGNGNGNGSHTDYLFYLPRVPVQAGGAEDDENSGLLVLKQLLRGVTRRVFAGKSYRSGEVVASAGGIIVMADDKRRRPDGSVLRIPMKHFLPAHLRKELRCKSSKDCEKSCTLDSLEEVLLVELMHQLDDLALVVTNELMFCPCLVLHDDEVTLSASDDFTEVESVDTNQHPVLGLCNVSFVLTIDALGCPYVAVVALKDISVFEPLLARIGC